MLANAVLQAVMTVVYSPLTPATTVVGTSCDPVQLLSLVKVTV